MIATDQRKLTQKQQLIWRLRHERGWTLRRIGQKLSINTPAACRLLRRAEMRYRDSARPKPRGRPKARTVRPLSLSSVDGF